MERENSKQTREIRGKPFPLGHKINVGRICSLETRKKIAEKQKGKSKPKHTEEWKKWFSKWLTENHPNRKEKTEKECLICKKKFYVIPCFLTRKFCSKECFNISQKNRKLSDKLKKKYSEIRKKEWATGIRKGGWKLSSNTKRMKDAEERRKQKIENKRIRTKFKLEQKILKKKEQETIKSLRPICQKCGKIIRRHNKMGMCQKHKNLSEIVKEKRKQKYLENRNKLRIKNNSFNALPENRKKKQLYDQKYRKLNGKQIDTRVKQWRKEQKKRNPLFKLKLLLQSRINHIYRAIRFKKNKRTMELVGTDLGTLKLHIENQFKEGMTWENHGKWHIDHIIPLATAKSQEEMEKLCHYTNLQPLWAIENLRKAKKLSP